MYCVQRLCFLSELTKGHPVMMKTTPGSVTLRDTNSSFASWGHFNGFKPHIHLLLHVTFK